MRQIETVNLLPFVVVSASPVFDPTVKPEKVTAPAPAPTSMLSRHEPSVVGAVIVNAPVLGMYCSGRALQSTVMFDAPFESAATLAPPEMI